MKIYRNGQEIELTAQELRQAYDELDREYHKEDIMSHLEMLEVELDDVESIVDDFFEALGNNDSYWDDYWYTADYVIKQHLKEMGLQ